VRVIDLVESGCARIDRIARAFGFRKFGL